MRKTNTNSTSKGNTSKADTSKRANSETPWFRKVKDAWYAWKDGKQVSLGVKGEDNRQQALEAFYRLMATGERDQPSGRNQEQKNRRNANSREIDSQKVKFYHASSSQGADMTTDEIDEIAKRVAEQLKRPEAEITSTLTFQELVNEYLEAKNGEVCEGTWQGYAKFLTPFARTFGSRAAASLRPEEAEDFAKKPEWSSTYRAGFLGTLVSLYRWGVRQRHFPTSPVEGVKKPPKASRGAKSVISPDEHRKLMDATDADFRDLLVMLWNTGARPSEITTLTAEQVKTAADGVIPLENHKTAHKGKPRSLILQGEAWNVVTKRAKQVGTGLLFTGQSGQQLTSRAVSAKMARLSRKAGTRSLNAYGYRHTFATQALVNGLPDATVSALLGHADTSMLHKHYSHLTSQTRAMKEALAKVRPNNQ